MLDPAIPEPSSNDDSSESFETIFSQYEREHARKPGEVGKQLEGTVIAVSADLVFVDVGYKTEGVLSLASFGSENPKPGDKLPVSIKGRNPEGYYELSRTRVQLPADWPALERAFAQKATIMGTVTGVIKGGLSVDVGVRAFMPASRRGVRDAAAMEKLVGQEIECRIIKVDTADEDVVVDRRAVLEEEEQSVKAHRVSELKEGAVVSGKVRTLADYGAFVDLGGVDALLHVSDMAWARVGKPSDVLSIGQELEVRVLKIATEGERRRISVGLKQTQADPWSSVAEKYKLGARVTGTVTRVMEFGAFVELEPGIEGLIHISEMSWGKKLKIASQIVKPGETVEAVILGVNAGERRISLGLKQALGDPWAEVPRRFAAGTVIEGPVVNLTKFGAFVQLAEGVEGMVHISDITSERRINHPQDMLKIGQVVRAQVLAVDPEKRQLRLGMKQLLPDDIDKYVAEHKVGDIVTGRVVESAGANARVELGEGIFGNCSLALQASGQREGAAVGADLSSLTSMLQARWKGSTGGEKKSEELRAGQVRSFRIVKMDPSTKQIELGMD
jgi:small subunit ribosomal protein S1